MNDEALKFYDEVIIIADGIIHVSREWMINVIIMKRLNLVI